MAKAGKYPEVRFTVSAKFFEYLAWLAKETVLGKTENDVAQQILTDRLSEMKDEIYKPDG